MSLREFAFLTRALSVVSLAVPDAESWVSRHTSAGGEAVALVLRRGLRAPALLFGMDALMLLHMTHLVTTPNTLLHGWCDAVVRRPFLIFAGHASEAVRSLHGFCPASARRLYDGLTKIAAGADITSEFLAVLAAAHKRIVSGFGKAKYPGGVLYKHIQNAAATIGIVLQTAAMIEANNQSPILGDRLADFGLVDLRAGNLVSEGRLKAAKARIEECVAL